MTLLPGDCLERLKELPDNSIDSVVTDPPYGLSFMGKKWDYDVPGTAVWAEVLRVLKPGGHVLSFGGTRTYHRLAINIEEAGFEIRDQIQWIYGSGFPKSHNLPGGIGTALKPANEPIVLARKPLIGTVAKNVEKFGTGGLNIDESRIVTNDSLNGGAYGGAERVREAQRTLAGGKLKRGIGEFSQPQGRWPANVIFDEESSAMLDEQVRVTMPGMHNAGNKKTSIAKRTPTSMFGCGGDGAPTTLYNDRVSASRFFYCAKASKSERNAGLEGMPKIKRNITDGHGRGSINTSKGDGTGIRENKPCENHHPTVKPIKLMQYLIKLITPPGGTVLDPFMGSGSTGVAAVGLGFDFIGCEMNQEYLEIAKRRIDYSKIRESA